MTIPQGSYDMPTVPMAGPDRRRWTPEQVRGAGATRAAYPPFDPHRVGALRFISLVAAFGPCVLWAFWTDGGRQPMPPWLAVALLAVVLIGCACWLTFVFPGYVRLVSMLRDGETVVSTWAPPAKALRRGTLIVLLDENQIEGWEEGPGTDDRPYVVEVQAVERSKDGSVTVRLPEGHWRRYERGQGDLVGWRVTVGPTLTRLAGWRLDRGRRPAAEV